MLSAMYAHTCESCGDTGLIIFDQDKTHIDFVENGFRTQKTELKKNFFRCK